MACSQYSILLPAWHRSRCDDQALVDCYGEVPYTEALDVNNATPHYDSGETIYKGIIAEINDALSRAKATDRVCTNFLFPGQTADPWIKFANALKLKLYSRMGGSDGEIAALLDESRKKNLRARLSLYWKGRKK